jgi:thioredoxin-like negative regulator of GroEL
MLPMLQDMAQEMAGKVRIVKFNCNQVRGVRVQGGGGG